MNALHVAERSAVYALEDAVAPVVGEAFDLLATAPQGVTKLRELILSLATQGKLVAQSESDEPASALLPKLAAIQRRMVATGVIRQTSRAADNEHLEQPSDLPAGWSATTLSTVAWPQAGFAFKSAGFNDNHDGIPLIRIRDVGASTPRTFFSGEFRDEFLVHAGDWLIGMDGDFRVAQWAGPDALLNQRVTRLQFFGDIAQPTYVCIALQQALRQLQGTKAYTTVDHLSGKQIASRVIPLPPAAEQRRIVARVEELMGLCDELEARGRLQDEQHARLVATLFDALVASTSPAELADNWQRIARHFDLLLDRPEAVDALEQTILQLAVRGLLVPQDPTDEPASVLLARIRAEKARLVANGELSTKKLGNSDDESPIGGLPSGWASSSIAEIGIVNPRNTAPDDSLASFVPMNSVPIELLDRHTSDQRVWSDIKTGFTHFGEGDVGVAKITPCFENGKSTIFRNLTNGIGAGTTELHVVRPLGGVLPEYILLFVKSPRYLKDGEAVMTGTAGQKRLPRSYFENVPFPLPPMPEQSRIVARVRLLFGLCADLRQHLQQAQTTQSNLADALVNAAVQDNPTSAA